MSRGSKMASIKVAVRVRPFNDRERLEETDSVVEIQAKTVIVTDHRVPVDKDYDHRQRVHRFTFDYCYWSVDPSSRKYVSQRQVYDELGEDLLRQTINGYNCCLFAYGQSGSGKTYSLMGRKDCPGLIPLLCQGMFEAKTDASRLTFITDISCMEIYNERVYDLLNKREDKSLRVREHPIHGPYVDGLSRHVVQDTSTVTRLIDQITENRNTQSPEEARMSKYHTIFTVRCCQVLTDGDNVKEVNTKLHLVDLAASERADLQFDPTRLKEGSNINKSLTTLGIVIASLASRERSFTPYRDSVLTWLLKDSVGGNSFTFMLATISPSSSCCSETISTLRYAQRVKKIINRPVINEAPTKQLLRRLKCEVNHLKEVYIRTSSKKEKMDVDVCLQEWNGESIVERQPNLELEAHLTVKQRSNLSIDGKMSDRNQDRDDSNSPLSPTFTGTLTSNYMVMLRDKISKQKQGNYIYRRLPFKVSTVDLNGRKRCHSDTDLSPSNLSQNFAIFRAAFARRKNNCLPTCQKSFDVSKTSGIDLSIDSLKSCKTLGEDTVDSVRPQVNYSEDSLKCEDEDGHVNEKKTEEAVRENPSTSDLCYSADSLAQCPETEHPSDKVDSEPPEVSPSTSTDSITFVFVSEEAAQTATHSDSSDQNMSPRTLSVDSLFAEDLLNEFRTNRSPAEPDDNPSKENSSEAICQDISTQTVKKSKSTLSPVPSGSNDCSNNISGAQLVRLMSDVVGLLKSGTTSCKCKKTYSKGYLRYLVESRKQMLDATINKAPKYKIVSRNIYSCLSSESSMSGGFSSSSYLGTTRRSEKCQRNLISKGKKLHGNANTKWRSDSGAVCSGSDDSSDCNDKRPDAQPEKDPRLQVPSSAINGQVGIRNISSSVADQMPNEDQTPERSSEVNLFPDDDYLSLPHLLKYTNITDVC